MIKDQLRVKLPSSTNLIPLFLSSVLFAASTHPSQTLDDLKICNFLAYRKRITDVSVSCAGDVLAFDTRGAYQKRSYDVTWPGTLPPFFTPDEACAYVNNLFRITKPEG